MEYTPNGFGVHVIIDKINKFIQEESHSKKSELFQNEIKNLKLIDVAFEVMNFPEVKASLFVFTHRFGFNVSTEERGRAVNITSFHSEFPLQKEMELFMPYDYVIFTEDNKLYIESQYVIEDVDKSLQEHLRIIDYHQMFTEMREDYITAFNYREE